MSENFWKWAVILATSGVTTTLSHAAIAQIVPDATLGVESTIVTPNADVRGLPASLIEGGATRGVNLFQSFSEFNIGDGQRVYFNNPTGIENIFTRVTGSGLSNILGTLGVDGQANLFLLNPNGIVFGPNAQLDVAGSFLGTTANSFVWENGLNFSATNPEPAPLIAVTLVPGLQYGANAPGDITSIGNLTVGQNLTLAGGNLDLQGNLQAGRDLTLKAQDTVNINGSYSTTGGNFNIEQLDGSLGNLGSNNGSVIRASGDVSFASYTGASLHILAGGSVNIPGQVEINGAAPTNGLTETITLSDGTPLNIDGKNSPTLDIRAGTTAFDPTGLIPNPIPGIDPPESIEPIPGIDPPPPEPIEPIPGIVPPTDFGNEPTSANIEIGTIVIQEINGQIFLTNQYNPNTSLTGGSIKITDGLKDNYSIYSIGTPVTIDAKENILVNQGIITGISEGTGGDIQLVSGGNINIGVGETGDSNTARGSLMSLANSGNGGNISLTSKEGEIQINGQIDSSTPNGRSGNISLDAKGDIKIANRIAADRVTTGDAPEVDYQSNPEETEEAQTITSGKIKITSSLGNINFLTEETTSDNTPKREIVASTSNGRGGDIKLYAPDGEIKTSGWTIRTDSQDGLAGNVNLEAGKDIYVGNIEASSILDQAASNDFTVINIQSNQGSVFLNQSRLSTSNSGDGFAGDTIINALNQISIIDSLSLEATPENEKLGIFSQGNFGRIFIGKSNEDASFSPNEVMIDNSELNTSNRVNPGSESQIDIDADSGNISINSQEKISFNNAVISTSTFGEGRAGSITIETPINPTTEIKFNGGNISSNVEAGGIGDGGEITIKTGSLSLENGARLRTDVFGEEKNEDGSIKTAAGQGNAGAVNINVESLSLGNPDSEQQTAIITSTSGKGNAGNVTITSEGEVKLIGDANIFNNVEAGGVGDGGKITIKAGSLSLEQGAQLQTLVRGAETNPDGSLKTPGGKGNAGEIDINVSGEVKLDGFRIGDNNFNLPSAIFSSLGIQAEGKAGNIRIQADSLDLKNGAELNTDTSGEGDAGFIDIKTNGSVSVDNAKIVSSVNNGAKGDAGYIQIQTDSLDLKNGAEISTSASGEGNAGFIDIDTNGSVSVDNAKIRVDSQGTGDAGDITLTADRLILNKKAEISSNTTSVGNGGNITLKLVDWLLMRRESQISTNASQNGNGGDITINLSPDKGFIVSPLLENNDIKANAFFGTGGKIDITAKGILGLTVITRDDLQRELGTNDPRELDPVKLPTNDITAISQTNPNLNGNVNVNSLELDPTQAIVNLPTNTTDSSTLIVQACAAGDGTIAGEFVDTGRGGLPSRPDEPLSGNAVWEDIRLRRTTTQEPISSNIQNTAPTTQQVAVIVPATGWVFNDKGEVTLISQTNQDNAPNLFSSSSCVSTNR
ncbi:MULTISPECIES: filamentous hemagglutinin N-terminal domain-containing protein [Cyanophyceae]|uniref:two-partner secretion domain-containing protein n=1 Tax=Cyanophyceae TaxID=3028117 RepID=UPI002330EB3E|nr:MULTISPECIES: filamentous hemagglutinin N-terminal domain-containing protein [Cyanophyceae]MDB9355759.1 filamentous hemagglutinin N-terminal domain-containing protein [Nodularia spumigena CS-587/03]MDB9341350.1 filamentous hemagglutinin N-terminal domain-containing protein [Nodularia spumigena CS-589/07]MDB9399163.1 filamentous hemagglutinin N-terminal domain-containing protein [Microcystis aeruginosa CS-567/02-A1]MDB9500202.1 filamentous hemagglutinin N-terminal domain-containing protein [N